jgi:uncharacterized protein
MTGTPSVSTSRTARLAFLLAGGLFVILGALGAILPVLPTTPFLLLAAACTARGSVRCHRWLTGNRLFGPVIRDWEEKRTVAPRVKLTATILVMLTFGTSIGFAVSTPALRIGLALLGVALLLLLWRLPSEERTAA